MLYKFTFIHIFYVAESFMKKVNELLFNCIRRNEILKLLLHSFAHFKKCWLQFYFKSFNRHYKSFLFPIPKFEYDSRFLIHSWGSKIFNTSRKEVDENRALSFSATLFAYLLISVEGLRYVPFPRIL